MVTRQTVLTSDIIVSWPGIWPNYLFLYKEILQDLRQQLVFKTDIQRVVDMMMVNITMENMDKEVVFVGVHCRRTDYAHQLWVNI